ncbi:hypothetical protein LIP_2217 [Limnochorda pilosa]|uniref:Uncharacterized protein n=1 Tax=Limnochorda pilosa TaxID=1555112 RepID=A0A0K2SLR2_LIMPI|nr:hypothetical protein LIP_2217 [Limnochorda pilosa]
MMISAGDMKRSPVVPAFRSVIGTDRFTRPTMASLMSSVSLLWQASKVPTVKGRGDRLASRPPYPGLPVLLPQIGPLVGQPFE